MHIITGAPTHSQRHTAVPMHTCSSSYRGFELIIVNSTKMTGILEVLGRWLQIRPTDFLSSDVMNPYLQFLQRQCENPRGDIASVALNIRRTFLLIISRSENR